LKLPDFAALPLNLGAHPLDFGSELVKLHGILVQPKPLRSAAAQPSSGGLPFPEAQAIPQSDDFSLFPGVHASLEQNENKVTSRYG
jgi:hypothetical protein